MAYPVPVGMDMMRGGSSARANPSALNACSGAPTVMNDMCAGFIL